MLFLVLCVILLSMPSVQTSLGKKITNHINKNFNTHIVINKLDLSRGSIRLKGIEILDHHKDSMLNVKSLTTSIFNYRNVLNNKLEFGDIDLDGVRLIMKTYKDEEKDAFSIFTQSFKNKNKDEVSSNFLLSSSLVNLSKSSFLLFNENNEDVKPLLFKNINGSIHDFKIIGAAVYGDIEKLSFVENHDVEVTNLTTVFSYTDSDMRFLNTELETQNSSVFADIVFLKNEGSFSDFNNSVKLDTDIKNATISLVDLNKFYGELGQNDILYLSTNINGTLNDFKINDLKMYSDLNSRIDGDFQLKNVFNKKEKFSLYAKLDNLTSNYNHLKNLLPNILEKTMPSSLKELGRFVVKGNTFITSDIIDADFNINTKIGTIISDLQLKNIDNIDKSIYKGHVKIIDFELGKFAKDSLLGKLSLDANVDGRGFTLEDINTTIVGHISKHQYKGYTYKNIDLNGQFENKRFNGKVIANDKNLKINFNGLADLSSDVYKFDFKSNVEYANFNKLNLFKRDSLAILKGEIEMKLTGNTVDNLEGDIAFKNATYTNQNDTYEFREFNITSSFKDSVRTIAINSLDIINGKAVGLYKFNELWNLTRNSIGSIYTNYNPFEVTSGQYIDFNFKIHNKIVEVFYPEIILGPNTAIRGNINSDDNEFKLSVRSPKIEVYKNVIDDIRLQIDNKNPLFNTQLSVNKIKNKFYDISDLNLVNITLNDTLFFRTEFKGGLEKTETYNLGFYHTIDANKKSVVGVNKSDFTFKNETWFINSKNDTQNKVVFDNKLKSFDIQKFDFVSGQQKINFIGTILNEDKDFDVNFENVNLAGITPDIKNWNFAGLINGNVKYGKKNEVTVPIANIYVEDFFINESFLGNLNIGMEGKNSVRKFDVSVLIENENTKNLIANGVVDLTPKKPILDMNIDFERFKLDFFKPLGGENFTEIRGDVYGTAKLTGLLENPNMEGELFLDGAGLAFPYLNTNYDFEGTTVLELNNQTFKIIDLNLSDVDYQTKGTLLGEISHTQFKDWKLDLSLDTNNLLVLNTDDAEDALYYGQGFIDGNATINGFADNLTIDVNGKTNKGTYFVIPLNYVNTIQSSNLVTFTTDKKTEEGIELPNEVLLEKFKGLSLNFNLEVTKDAVVEMIIDKTTGSTLKGSGIGDLQIEIDTNGKFNMYGGFEVESGIYDFKYGRLVSKRFIATKGGTIFWDGSPYDAELNIETIYRVNANPKSILESVTTSRDIPVDLVTIFTGALYDSKKEFDIIIPDANSDLKSELDFKMNQSNDRNAKMRHFGSLLALGTFYNDESNIGDYGASLLTETGEGLINAISGLLTAGNDKFKFGIDYRIGDDRSNIANLNTDDQIGLTLATKLNDRILIDGKVGVPVGSKQKSSVVGEVKFEFLLNEEGTLRATVFNRQNEIQYTEEEEGYTQGGGLVYGFDFDNGRELLEKLGLKKKKEVQKDSVKRVKDSIDLNPKSLLNIK